MDSNGYQITLQHLAPGVKQERDGDREIVTDLKTLAEAANLTMIRAMERGLHVRIEFQKVTEVGKPDTYQHLHFRISREL